jgi:hypothetical protein
VNKPTRRLGLAAGAHEQGGDSEEGGSEEDNVAELGSRSAMADAAGDGGHGRRLAGAASAASQRKGNREEKCDPA